MRHPSEDDLALLAGGEMGRIHRFFLGWHLRNCEDCQDRVAEFRELRGRLAKLEFPDVNWDYLAAEMRANIRLGLEAGACVRSFPVSRIWSMPKSWGPRLGVALASLVVLASGGFFLTNSGLLPVMRPELRPAKIAEAPAPVLQPTRSGIELRKGMDSFAFLDRQGVRTEQTVSAQGAIEARYINGETGSVTINNVYLQQ